VETRAQVLPYESLAWEDFERLCLRCARTESDIERAQLYGIRGQKQAGIDLYARLATGEYRVYQCKNEGGFGPAKIGAAVDKFLNGPWADRAKGLVLCTRENLSSTDRSNEFEKQAKRLKAKDITLTAWDAGALDELMKGRPEIVDDFFGRPWVELFCGKAAANKLDGRLDASAVRAYRRDLRAFYSKLFLVHDRGLPAAAVRTGTPLGVYQRYVLPFVYHVQRNDSVVPGTLRTPSPEVRSSADDSRSSLARVQRQVSRRQRVALENWLILTKRAIVIADFGLGKTSLLRFLALDVLDDSPKLRRLAAQWGGRLPVWVPFALWTRLLSDPTTADTSLSDLLHKWLHSQNEERLWPLVEQALNDDRLLLLVDGLDEWSNSAAANIAGQRLALFVEHRNVPVVAVGRHAGISRLSLAVQDWPVGELADFERDQQRKLATQWIEHSIRCEVDGDDAELQIRTQIKVDELMQELSSPELSALARVPLLLSLLILLKLHNVTLPDDRFKAYDELLRHLITVHPLRRREVAGVSEPSSLSVDDTARVLADLAFTLQRDYDEGMLDRAAAIAIVEKYLKSDEGLGFDPQDARQLARELIDSEGAATGLLVCRSENTIGFFHRSLQEYLAAQNLSRLGLETQLGILREHARDEGWHEVIRGLLHLTSRRDDVQKFIDEMERLDLNPIEKLDLEDLLTEAAVGDYNLPPTQARRLLDRAINVIETGPWLPHRERLLSRLLRGLRQSPTGERIRRKIAQWFPGTRWRDSLYQSVGEWQNSEGILDTLWRGLYDDELSNQRAAALAMVQQFSGDLALGDRLARVCQFDQHHIARAVAIEALAVGWPSHGDFQLILIAATASASPFLWWAAIAARVSMGKHTSADLDSLLDFGRIPSGLDHNLRHDLPGLLAKGWSQSPILKAECLWSLDHVNYPQSLDHRVAMETLLRAFPNDVEIGMRLAHRIEHEQFPFIGLGFGYGNGWDLLAMNFKENAAISRAVDIWLDRDHFIDHDRVIAALYGRTSKGKAKLLAALNSGGFIHAPAFGLLEGWGIVDTEVRDHLLPIARDINSGARIAHLLPQIVEDRKECLELLLSMLASENCSRPDFVILGLKKLKEPDQNSKACTLALTKYTKADGVRRHELSRSIIGTFSDDPRVRPLAIEELERLGGNATTVAAAFGSDPEIRTLILARLSPLSSRLRDRIVVSLADRPVADPFANSLLRLYRHEQDPIVKTKASIAFHRRLSRVGIDMDTAIAQLSKDIVAYGGFGIDQASHRQAALCGLLELDRIGVFRKAKEDNAIGTACTVPLEDLWNINYPLLHCIGEHWSKLREALGSSLEIRLVDHIGSTNGFPWGIFGTVAAQYPQIAQELLAKIESETPLATTTNLLRFIAATRPKSLLLREKCLAAIRSHQRQGAADDTVAVAAEFLATHYRDDETFAELLKLAPVGDWAMGNAHGALLSLAEGWTQLTEVELRVDGLKGQMVPWDLFFALVGIKPVGVNEFILALAQLCRERGPFDMGAGHGIFKFCVRHLARCDQSYQLLLTHYLRPVDANLYLSAPGLLASARGIGQMGRMQLMKRLERELSGRVEPTVGYDLSSDQMRSAALALLDTLTTGEARLIP
jgi:hypothetical protein